MVIQYPLGAGGVVTRVLEAGEGDSAILLIHGVGARADRWRRNLEPLAAAGYHVYAVDLPGHGLAEKGTKFDYSVPNYARFARSVLDQLGVQSCHLVGTSLGGHIVATAACETPNRVKTVTLVGTLGMAPMGEAARQRTAGLVSDASPETITRKLHTVFHDDRHVTEALHAEELRINNSPGASESFDLIADYFTNQIDDHVVGERLSGLCPDLRVLLVWGRQDVGFPVSMGEAALALLDGSQLAIMDDCAHAPYYERPNAFNRIVTSFFDGNLSERVPAGVELRN